MELNYKKKLLMSGMDNKEYTGLRFTAEEDNVQFTFSASEKIRYWAPHSVWMRLVNNGSELKKFPSTPLKKGESVVICGGFSSGTTSVYNGTFSSTGKFSVSGNIMSLIGEYDNPYQESFINKVNLTNRNYVFSKLFLQCDKLIKANNLILPATTLSNGCYYMMFKGCTSLTYPPALPATTVYQGSYCEMFYNCSSLVSAPTLPATTLAVSCYQDMFYNCSRLVNAPALPATNLAIGCYQGMFNKCSGLIKAPAVLPATTLAISCYQGMFNNCYKLINVPAALPATTLAVSCYQDMFNKCTSLVNAPALPATTLVTNCYKDMFNGCSNLSNIIMLATDTSASNCLNNWVAGVKNTGTITIDDNTDLISNKTEDNWYGPSLIPKDNDNRWVISSESDHNPLSIDNKSDFNIRVGYSCVTGITSKYKIVDTSILESYNNTFGAYNDFSNMEDMPSYSTADINNTTKELQPGQSIIFLGSLLDSFSDSMGSIIIKLPDGKKSEDLKGDICVSGSILSMIYNDNYNRYYNIPDNVSFYNLFASEPITYAQDLMLDFTLHDKTIGGRGIYERMFYGSALKTPPSTISSYAPPYCYREMFAFSGITEMPELPAETVGDYAYEQMFYECRQLKDVNPLRAHTLGKYCYRGMFSGSGIDKIPTLRKSVTAGLCSYYEMFSYCDNLTTISSGGMCSVAQYSDGGSSYDGSSCFEGMFRYCNNLKFGKIPSCPMTENCFKDMFNGCYNLIGFDEDEVDTSSPYYITVNGVNYHYPVVKSYEALAPNCFEGMFSDCTSLVIPPINLQRIKKLAPYCFKNMFSGCTSLVYGPFLPMTDLTLGSIDNKPTYNANDNQGDHHCFEGMFQNCSSLKSLGVVTDYNNNQINAVILPGEKLASSCYRDMFSGCTKITHAHICASTPKTDIYDNAQHYAYDCYQGMFNGCENLNNVKIADSDCWGGLETPTSSSELQGSDSSLASGYYFGYSESFWMNDVNKNGNFYKTPGSKLGYYHRLPGTGPSGAGAVPNIDYITEEENYNWSLSTSIVIATNISISSQGDWIIGHPNIDMRITTRI